MTQPRITIIGLGRIGGSIGMALRASTTSVHIVGHDVDIGRSRLAKKKGGVDETSINLLDACRDADLVVIATPITAIRETLEAIGPHLKHGCVVTDTATLKQPVLMWAAETLSDGVSFVGGDPILNPNAQPNDLASTQTEGAELARADLFQDALYALCAPPETPPTAVKRVTDMVGLIKARPFYVGPAEHDGMRAAVDGLPVLTSLALMQEIGGSPGWKEARKLADHILGMTTIPLADDAQLQRTHILLNADHLLPRLDALLRAFGRLREWVSTENAAALEEAFGEAASVRSRWLSDRASSQWEDKLGEMGVSGTMGSLGGMLGFGSGRRKPKEK